VFHAFTPEHGTELWSTDGTPEGTAMIKDVVEGREPSDTWQLTRWGNAAYFTARKPTGESAIWKTDGTTAGT
jgi:ELWxxDGT repeat protein